MKIKWRHKQKVGKVKWKSEEVVRMLSMGAKFELAPAYRTYFDKDGNTTKVELMHVSLRLLRDENGKVIGL